MKGLELSRAFWEDAVRPAIRETCPVLLPRLAVALATLGVIWSAWSLGSRTSRLHALFATWCSDRG